MFRWGSLKKSVHFDCGMQVICPGGLKVGNYDWITLSQCSLPLAPCPSLVPCPLPLVPCSLFLVPCPFSLVPCPLPSLKLTDNPVLRPPINLTLQKGFLPADSPPSAGWGAAPEGPLREPQVQTRTLQDQEEEPIWILLQMSYRVVRKVLRPT